MRILGELLRFHLRQIFVPSLGKYFLPLPKLGEGHLRAFAHSLEGRGLRVNAGPDSRLQLFQHGERRATVYGALGLAVSANELTDLLGPSIPSVLAAKGEALETGLLPKYLSMSRSKGTSLIHLFPRMESLRTWTCLRMDGLCGLTPDEAVVLRQLLENEPESTRVECVTSMPVEGSIGFQAGSRLYYKSVLPPSELLSSLRTVDSDNPDHASYLPKNSVLRLKGRPELTIPPHELGEWCLVG